MDADDEIAASLVAKLRAFIGELTPSERELFAALLAPGVALAYDELEVEGFSIGTWTGGEFPAALGRVLRESEVRVVGLEQP